MRHICKLALITLVAILAGCTPGAYEFKDPAGNEVVYYESPRPYIDEGPPDHDSAFPAYKQAAAAEMAEVLGPVTDRWAVAIGVDQYEDAAIPALRTAEADARAVGSALESIGFEKDHILMLLGADASRSAIRSSLGTFLAERTEPTDLVVIFFAGHGAPEVDRRQDVRYRAPDGIVRYLVPYDAMASDLWASAIPMEEIGAFFDRIPSRRIVFISDACYSGGLGGRSFGLSAGLRGFGGLAKSDQWLPARESGSGVVILTASSASEPVVEDVQGGRGVFTGCLLEGLRGDGATASGEITVQSLYRYLSRTVPERAKAFKVQQHPLLKGTLAGDIVLARVNPRE